CRGGLRVRLSAGAVAAPRLWHPQLARRAGGRCAPLADEHDVDAGAPRLVLEGRLSRAAPVPATDWVADAVGQAAAAQGLETLSIPSGAGHDASYMAPLGPMGMIFVRAGRSHCPEERPDVWDIAKGIAVLVSRF